MMKSKHTAEIIAYVVIIAFLAFVPAFVKNLYWLGVITTMLIHILLTTSFWLVMTTGQINLGHAGLAAIGGYMSAALVTVYGFNSWLSLPIAIAVAAVVALVIGVITLRITGIYFIITTIALAEVIKIVFGMWEYPFGGLVGILNIPPANPLKLPGISPIGFATRPALYYLVLVFVLIGTSVVWRVNRSSVGLIFRGIRESDKLAEHVGIYTMKFKLVAFVLGSACAALGGVLYTYTTGAMLPTSFTMIQANYYLVWAAVGGLGSFAGPLVGTAVLSVLSEFLRPVKEYESIIYAGMLICAVLVFKGGLVGASQRMLRLFAAGRKKRNARA